MVIKIGYDILDVVWICHNRICGCGVVIVSFGLAASVGAMDCLVSATQVEKSRQ